MPYIDIALPGTSNWHKVEIIEAYALRLRLRLVAVALYDIGPLVGPVSKVLLGGVFPSQPQYGVLWAYHSVA